MTYKIDVSQQVCDLRGNPLPIGGHSGHLSRIFGQAVIVPGDPEHEKITTLADALITVLEASLPNEQVSADDKRKRVKLARRVVAAAPWFELEIGEGEDLQKRGAEILPIVEFGFLDDVLEVARAEAILAEKNAASAESATADDGAPTDEAT